MHYCYSGRPRPTRSDTTDALPACVPATPSPCGPTNGPRSCVLGAWGCTSKISCRQVQIPMPTLGRNGNPPSSRIQRYSLVRSKTNLQWILLRGRLAQLGRVSQSILPFASFVTYRCSCLMPSPTLHIPPSSCPSCPSRLFPTLTTALCTSEWTHRFNARRVYTGFIFRVISAKREGEGAQ